MEDIFDIEDKFFKDISTMINDADFNELLKNYLNLDLLIDFIMKLK